MQVLEEIRASKMTRFQVVAVSVALTLILMDGFDVAAMAYAAPTLGREWGVTEVMMGYLLSASLFGMAAGSIFITPLGDVIGRRNLTIGSMAVITIGMALSPFADGPVELIVYRVITGLGVGGMMANLNVLVSEYSSDARRGSIIGIYAAGYPIGATIGGLVAGPLIPVFGWQSLFVVGAVISAIGLALTIFYLPESFEFLSARRPAGALEKFNRIMVKMNREPVDALPELPETVEKGGAIREVMTGRVLFHTLMLWLGYALLVAAYYFANTWTPRIISSASGNDTLGVNTGVLANFGGILGCFVFSALAIRFRSNRLLAGAMIAAAASYVVFGVVFEAIPVAMGVALVLGLTTTAGIAGFYAVAPEVYTAKARATGIGWMIGIGRLVSIIAPILVGYLLDGGWRPENVFFLFAAPLVGSALCVIALSVSMRQQKARLAHTAPQQSVPTR